MQSGDVPSLKQKAGSTPRISVITVTFNSEKTIERLVTSLHTYLGDIISEFLVIDNHSSDLTAEAVRRLQAAWPKTVLLEQDSNLGYRRAVNKAVRLAANDLLLVINPDAWVVDDSLKLCVKVIADEGTTGYVSPVIVEPETWFITSAGSVPVVPFLAWWPEAIPTGDSERSVHIGPGAAFFVRRSVFLGFGGYDERPFMFNEEEEVSLKMRQRGLSVKVHPSARVYHDAGHSVRSTGHRWEFLFTHEIRNARYFYFTRVDDSRARRLLWTLVYIVRAVEYSLAIGKSGPLRVALAPSAIPLESSPTTTRMRAEWNLRLSVEVMLRSLKTLRTVSGRRQ